MDNYIPTLQEALDELYHYGILRRSGRYPWGSGEHPCQRLGNFYSEYKRLMSEGASGEQMAKQLKMSTSQIRARVAYYQDAKTLLNLTKCIEMSEQGKSNVTIAKELGISEGAVRSLLKKDKESRTDSMIMTMMAIKDCVDQHRYVDVGDGVDANMNITKTKLDQAVLNLTDEGYKLYSDIHVKQGGSGNFTTRKVLAAPDVTKKEVYEHISDVQTIDSRAETVGGKTEFKKPEPPVNIDSKRIIVRYADDPDNPGTDMDGVIELRRGVEDLSLGNAHYAQVRIAVDGKYYAKGMAVYADDLPDGVDIRVNSNKKSGTPLSGVLKPQNTKIDRATGEEIVDDEDPFSAAIKDPSVRRMVQQHYIGKDGKEHLSALNIVTEEGDWERWSKNLPSQFLSKQRPELAKKQLDLAAKTRDAQFDEIQQITNPTLRRQMLLDFGNECDRAAANLKAASLPRQQTHVILPVTDIKEDEIYAPNYEPGETVALIRYPHGGIFEIPVLRVNNNSKQGKQRITPEARDAVGIHPKAAAQLSGADFDGDTVAVIPLKNVDLKTSKPLEELRNFDTKTLYATTEEDRKSGRVKVYKDKSAAANAMGVVTNLITDMTLQDAPIEDIVKAVKHSMVTIDAYKHKLDYHRSYVDNDIAALKKKYQTSYDPRSGEVKVGGAGTIISRANADTKIPHRRSRPEIAPDGSLIWTPSGRTVADMRKVTETVIDENGKKIKRVVQDENGRDVWEYVGQKEKQQKVPRMALYDDPYMLTSGGSKENPGFKIEGIYAEYASRMKALGNKARKETLSIKDIPVSKSAAETYAPEVARLKAAVNEARKNSPFERQALALAQVAVKMKKEDNPNMSQADESKALDKELKKARAIVGAHRKEIDISDREWEAIQAGAVPKTTLEQVIRFADQDKLKERAMPKERKAPSSSTISAIKSMIASGYTREEVAKRFDISTSTLSRYLDMK